MLIAVPTRVTIAAIGALRRAAAAPAPARAPLDLAESELGVLSSQCLARRILDKQTLSEEIAAWKHDRNANNATANWHFTTPNERGRDAHY